MKVRHCITLDGLWVDANETYAPYDYRLRYVVDGVTYTYGYVDRERYTVELLAGFVHRGEEYCVRICDGVTETFIFQGNYPGGLKVGVDRELISGLPEHRNFRRLQRELAEYMAREMGRGGE